MMKFGGCTLGPDAQLERVVLSQKARTEAGRPQGSPLRKASWMTTCFVGANSMFALALRSTLTMMLFALLISTSSAQPQNVLKLTTDHSVYSIGKRIVVRARVGQDGFLYLFNIRADGLVDLPVPNRFADGDSRSWAGETRRFPDQDSGWWFVAPEPSGKHHLIAFLAPNGLKLDGLARFDAGNPFAVVKVRGQAALEQALKSRVPNAATRADLEYLVTP
jgi:Domain of unknown function (DUF4384)